MVSSVYHFCYFFGTLVYLQSYVVNVKFSHPWQFHKTWNRHLYWKEFSDSKYQKCLDMVIILLLQDQGVRNCCSWYRRFWQILYNIKVLYLSQNYSLPVIKTPLQKSLVNAQTAFSQKKDLLWPWRPHSLTHYKAVLSSASKEGLLLHSRASTLNCALDRRALVSPIFPKRKSSITQKLFIQPIRISFHKIHF